MDADLSATGPFGQSRIRARLEREGSEKRVVRNEAGRDVELPERSLTAGGPDGHLGVKQSLAAPEHLDPPEAAMDDDATLRRLQRRRSGRDPTDRPVRSHRQVELEPGGPVRPGRLADCPPDLRNWEWYRLQRMRDESIRTITAAAPLMTVAWSPDAQRVAGAGENSIARCVPGFASFPF